MKGLFLSFVVLSSSAWGQITFSYSSAAETGFFSTETRAPVGGNLGETLGEQRRNAMEEAARIWELYLAVNGPVEIAADFEELGCNGGIVLGGAFPAEMSRNFPEAPLTDTWYVGALANSLAGRDLFPDGPEIDVVLNSQVDSDPNCSNGFYYGFDGNNRNQIDFLRVVIHELGHGLGFASLGNGQTGALPSNTPDSFTRNLLDLPSGQTWDLLTSTERAASAISNQVAWAGRNTQLAGDGQINSRFVDTSVAVVASGNEEGALFPALEASFGGSLPTAGLTGELVLMDDGVAPVTDACEDVPAANAAALAGRIVLIDRGECLFTEKVLRAETAGALAVVMVNNAGNGLISMGGEAPFPAIPSLFVGQVSGEALRALAPGTEVTLDTVSVQNGTQDGRPFMYVPTTFQSGSSVSHFDSGLNPDLLMEPNIGENRIDPDLAITVMRDIGWQVEDVPFPNLDYELWQDLFVTGAPGRAEDSDGDGFDNFSEYAFGSDPEEPSSKPGCLQLTLENNLATASFFRTDQATDLTFSIRRSETLTDDFQAEVAGNPLVAESTVGLAEDTWALGPVSGRQFFRVEVEED